MSAFICAACSNMRDADHEDHCEQAPDGQGIICGLCVDDAAEEKVVLPGNGQAVGGVREPRQARDLTICMECSAKAVLVGGRAIYPHRPDLYGKRFWLCECGAYVGCHPGTQDPLGCPAGPAARKARNAAHAAFDPIWRSRQMSRSEAYKWLASELGQRASETHISWMDEATALKVAHICSAASPAERSDVARDDQKAVS